MLSALFLEVIYRKEITANIFLAYILKHLQLKKGTMHD
jgi:hypothetical protein